jgi:membrane protein DedA with SNARE-associated domain
MENFLTTVMTSHGYLALIIFAFVEACCIPISSEITFAFAGVIAATHPDKFSILAVIIIGTLAELAGSTLAYAVGRRGGRPLLEKYGKWVLVSQSDLDRAERFFAGRGSWAVAVARALPLVRCFAGFGAGVVEVPALPFMIFNAIGTLVWTTALTLLGYNLGHTVDKFFKTFSTVGIILIVLLIGGLILHRVHALRKDAHRRDAAAAQAQTQMQMQAQAQASPGDPQAQIPPAGPAAAPRRAGVGTGNGTGRSGGAHRSGRGPTP